MSVGPQNPTARVEYALRADEALSEPQVRQIMEYYLAVRVRRFARTYSSVGSPEPASNGNGSLSLRLRLRAPERRCRPAVAAAPVYRALPPRYGAPRPRRAAADPHAGSTIDTSPGHDLNVPPRSGLGDSERRSAGAGVRIFRGLSPCRPRPPRPAGRAAPRARLSPPRSYTYQV